jgi:predicted dehydrogenase
MKLGYVGLGWAARSFQYPALQRVPSARAVGGIDSSPEQRASWTQATGLPAYATMEELLEQGQPDALVIATPPDSHAELCLQALAAGVHVLCEKPFVATVEEADRVLEAAKAAGRQVAVNHEFREKPIFKVLKEKIGSADAGRLVFTQIWQLMNLAPWDEPVAWRRAMPNRTLFEGGVHLVDLLLMLYGELPQAVYARHSAGTGAEHEADAINLVTFEFPRGRLAQLTINRLCPAGTRYVEVRADCERASLRASLGGRAVLQVGKKRAESAGVRLDLASGGLAWREQGLKRRTLAKNPSNAGRHATAALLRRIFEAFKQRREPPSSGREARDVLAIIEAAYRSAVSGERVAIPTAADVPAAADADR